MLGLGVRKSFGVLDDLGLLVVGPLSLGIETAFCFEGSQGVMKRSCSSPSHKLGSEVSSRLSLNRSL